MDVPETRYARVGDLRIAYQEFGSGEPLIIIPPLISNVELSWESEQWRRVLEHMGRSLRTAMFDKRGIGLSDRWDQIPTLDQRIEDIVAVMEALGWQRTDVLGMSEGGTMAQHFAVRHPERVRKLALVNTMAPPVDADRIRELSGEHHRDMSEIWSDLREVAASWGEAGEPVVRLFVPSMVDDVGFQRWIARFDRLSASPASFRRQVRSVANLAEGIAPEAISAPTIIVHVIGDRAVPVGNGHRLAELIPGAECVVVDGADHFWMMLDNWRDVADPIIEFFTGRSPSPIAQRRFASVLFTDIVGSTELARSMGDDRWSATIDAHDRITAAVVARHGGRVVKSTGDGALAIFDAPSPGVHASVDLRHELHSCGLTIRAGLHAGEIEVHDDAEISGVAVNLAARVEQAAEDGEILVSSTMKDLLLGSGIALTDRGERSLKGIDGSWRLYAVG